MDTRNLLVRTKNAQILISLRAADKRWYPSNLARESGLSYVYVVKLISKMKTDGLVDVKKEGKINRAVLTEAGMRAANALDELMTKLPIAKEKSNNSQ